MDKTPLSDDLYEYDKPQGRLQVLLHRTKWRWILAGIMALAFGIPFLIVQLHQAAKNGADSSENFSNPLSLSLSFSPPHVGSDGRSSKLLIEYRISGKSPTEPLTNFTDFDDLANQSRKLLVSVFLSNLMLDAASFSNSLEGCLDLQQITLENIWLVGNFSRVYLPNILSFTYIQNGNDKRDSYKSPESLKTTLFFDKTKASNWSVEKDLLNLGTDITISKAGTKLIDIRRSDGEIFLNVKYCQSLLLNVKGSFDKLTLVNCNLTSDSLPVIPSTLTYLNLRNSFPPTEPLSQLLRKQTKLEEFYGWLTFHCERPGYELIVNISDLPSTTKKIGLNNVDWSFSPSGKPSSIKELTVGDFMTESMIFSGFPKLFQNLEKINIINVSSNSYLIIDQAIKMKVAQIEVVNLNRDYSRVTEHLEDIIEVESIILNQPGIPNEMSSALILQRSDFASNVEEYVGRELSIAEQHEVRYKGLGFDKVDTLEDYLKWDSLQ